MPTDYLPVFWLTLRQFLEGRSIRIVALLAAAPLLLGIIEIIASGSDSNVRLFLGQLFNELSIPTLLPLIALILATTALSNEISDRTLPYLVLKPWSRFRLVIEKFTAVALTGILVSIVLSFAVWIILGLVASEADGNLLVAIIAGTIFAIIGYAATFSLLSLMVSRVLLAGLIYVLFWESLLARFIPGIRLLSIRHYVQSIYTDILNDGRITVPQQSELTTAMIVLISVVSISLLLSYLRLRRMDLD
jgi:ABC-2 type transport system permease protein